jgi:hypothetical protein
MENTNSKQSKVEGNKPVAKTVKRKNSLSNRIQKFLLKEERVPYRIDETTIARISTDEAKFYLEQAGKQLEDSVDTGKIITERATNMLNLSAAILIALIAYSIDRWETNQRWDLLLKMAVWGNLILVFASALLIAAILPKDYCVPGWTPQRILESRSFKERADDSTRQKNVSLNLLMNYENDIKENQVLNKKRWALFNWSMLIILVAPICFASYYLLFR